MVSIIIPAYNEGGYLDATLRHLSENLSAPDFEIIVSDSRSTDDTAAIALRYAGRVTLVQMPDGKKRGISQGRNDGAAIARGDFFVFMDADVIIPHPQEFFARALAHFSKNPRLLAIAAHIAVDPPRAHISDRIIYAVTNAFFAVLNLCGVGIAAGEFQMIRADAFREMKGYREDLAASEDVNMFQGLARKGVTRVASDLTVFHSGRRFRKTGAWRTVYLWIRNTLSLWIFKKSADKEWETIR